MVFFMSDDGSIPLQILSAADTTGGGSLALQIFLIIFLTFLNAFFASSEIALLSVNDTKLKKEAENGDKKAALLLKIVENPSRFLSTIQVGVTFSGQLLCGHNYKCPGLFVAVCRGAQKPDQYDQYRSHYDSSFLPDIGFRRTGSEKICNEIQ